MYSKYTRRLKHMETVEVDDDDDDETVDVVFYYFVAVF